MNRNAFSNPLNLINCIINDGNDINHKNPRPTLNTEDRQKYVSNDNNADSFKIATYVNKLNSINSNADKNEAGPSKVVKIQDNVENNSIYHNVKLHQEDKNTIKFKGYVSEEMQKLKNSNNSSKMNNDIGSKKNVLKRTKSMCNDVNEKFEKAKILSPNTTCKKKSNTKQNKKIKIVINIECETSQSTNTVVKVQENEKENCITANIDLSFLDDINVDEIVDSLHDDTNSEIPTVKHDDENTNIYKTLKSSINKNNIKNISEDIFLDNTEKSENKNIITVQRENSNNLMKASNQESGVIDSTETLTEVSGMDNNYYSVQLNKPERKYGDDIKEYIVIEAEDKQNNHVISTKNFETNDIIHNETEKCEGDVNIGSNTISNQNVTLNNNNHDVVINNDVVIDGLIFNEKGPNKTITETYTFNNINSTDPNIKTETKDIITSQDENLNRIYSMKPFNQESEVIETKEALTEDLGIDNNYYNDTTTNSDNVQINKPERKYGDVKKEYVENEAENKDNNHVISTKIIETNSINVHNEIEKCEDDFNMRSNTISNQNVILNNNNHVVNDVVIERLMYDKKGSNKFISETHTLSIIDSTETCIETKTKDIVTVQHENSNSCNLMKPSYQKAGVIETAEALTESSAEFDVLTAKNNPVSNQKEYKSKEVTAVLEHLKSFENMVEEKVLFKNIEDRMFSYLKNRYTITSVLHKGKYSTITKCVDNKGNNYAIKILNNNSNILLGMKHEKILLDLQMDIPEDNYNCVRLFNGFGANNHWCLFMEFYPKNLREVLVEKGPFNIKHVRNLSSQLVSAVVILKNKHLVHSDIKPSHILINSFNNRLKLCGFDELYVNGKATLLPNIGTSNYRAPEVILGHSASYGIDVWATALVMYEMATGLKLFPGSYNNYVLYTQQCILGKVPVEMLYNSLYRKYHFIDNRFIKREGYRGQNKIMIDNFVQNESIAKTLTDVYFKRWRNSNTEQADLFHLAQLKFLLQKMLVINPYWRLSIEFVYADPFILQNY